MPSRLYPDSLIDQLQYILREWSPMLPEGFIRLLRSSIDYINEEEKDRSGTGGGAPASIPVMDYSSIANEYEAFSSDSNWMPCVVMIAKSTLVWLDQLSKAYKHPITSLDQIPDEELDTLQHRGITALWLIGLWQRSEASKEIKHLCGNPDAVASAYSLKDYDISPSIGGWEALYNLKERCQKRGIRLASDMVPNHTGIDGNWVYEHPDYYISQSYPPFPSYTYDGPDLSTNPYWEVKIEDHYYTRTDAAVTFRMRNRFTDETRYVFHGNDGTTMPWNDTAQLDYLNPVTREAVIEKILHVARNFPIIRFDAAMTLAKRHIERLWYPKPGEGGDIPGRSEHALDEKEFNAKIPEEFWREVVDRVAKEVPDTLLLAEAFWMMEGYFVRTLGMHRVYNSAFMNMLKNQENKKYRDSIKNTLVFEPEILKRYVNFMNNPDEDTAISQFGSDDRYFGVCTLLATLPGLPMIGHGQIEGYKLRTGKMLNNDWKRFDQAVSKLQDAKLYIDDTPGITIGEIRAKCRRLSSSSDGLDLVIIDYLQLISGGKNYGANRQQEVADISRSLKTLAMELHIPVIALAQLSRSVEGREDKRPMLSDLRESGSIEQDADLVGFLYRDDYYTKEASKDSTSLSEFIIAKHRNGPQATINLIFKKDTSTFRNATKKEEEEQ